MKQTKRSLGLYIHIPFCRSKCIYCDFYSLPREEEKMKAYTKALIRQLSETAPLAKGHRVDTVYFGGGTPTLLEKKLLKAILKTIKTKYDVAPDAEITLEANPESAGEVRFLRSLRRAGFNRLSLGVQTANDERLKAIGRIHTFEQVEKAVKAARKAGIKNLSLDLIYGLPDETLEDFRETLQKAVALEPEHISCYGLKVEEGTPLFAMQEQLHLPDDDEQADMYLYAVAFLEQNGYYQYEISNFAREGKASQHNRKYWMLQEYAGFGPGAHSDFGEVRYAYPRDLTAYIKGMEDGTLTVSEREWIPLRERETEYIMLSLRRVEGIDEKYYENTFRRRFAPLKAVLEKYEAMGYAQKTHLGYRLTPKGFLLSNTIITELWSARGEDILRREEAAARGDYRIVP